MKLKGKLWGEWYNVVEDEKEDDEGDRMEEGDGNDEEDNDEDEEGEVDGVMEDDLGGENVLEDKNYLIDFVLQLEYVAYEDDKANIQRLWKKEPDHVNNM